MSTNGLEVFDKTIQTTHTWLNDITERIGPDRQLAWHVLGTVLRTVRDRIPIELAAHLGAELPLLVRGLYYDQWRPSAEPERYRSLVDFLDEILINLGTSRPIAPQDAAKAVFATLTIHLPEGQVRKIRQALPEGIRALWPETIAQEGPHRVVVEDNRGSMSRRA